MRGKISYLLSLLVMAIIISMAPATVAPGTTYIGAPTILDEAAAPGAAVDIPITVTDVIDLYGFDFKLGFNPCVLTPTGYTIGDFLPDHFEWRWEMGVDYVWLIITRRLGAAGGITGSGLLATIHLTLIAEGASPLDLYDTTLSDSSGYIIAHSVTDGGYSTTADISVRLLSGFVEDSRWEESKDADKLVELSASIKNEGSGITATKVVFTMYDDLGGPAGTVESDTVCISPNEVLRLSAYFDPDWPMRYDVEMQVSFIDASGVMVDGLKGGHRDTMAKHFVALP